MFTQRLRRDVIGGQIYPLDPVRLRPGTHPERKNMNYVQRVQKRYQQDLCKYSSSVAKGARQEKEAAQTRRTSFGFGLTALHDTNINAEDLLNRGQKKQRSSLGASGANLVTGTVRNSVGFAARVSLVGKERVEFIVNPDVIRPGEHMGHRFCEAARDSFTDFKNILKAGWHNAEFRGKIGSFFHSPVVRKEGGFFVV